MFEIYGRNNCQWCKQAIALVREGDFDYKYFNIEEDPKALIAFKEHFPGAKTVPQIRINTWTNDSYGTTEHIGGYEDLVKWLNRPYTPSS